MQVNSSTFTPLPGDLVMFTWQAWAVHEFSHIGIVTAVNGGSIIYVDGNSGTGNGRVASHVMNKTSTNIIGYIRFDTNKALLPSDPPEYFNCDVMISCVNGQVVNLYNNPGDSVRADYFSLGQAVRSTYGAKMCDGTTWYQITAASLGVVKTFWLKYESGKMTVDNFQLPQSAPCSHTWDAGTETVFPTLTSSGIRLRTCTICGEETTEAIEHLTSVSGTCGDNARWRIDDQGTLTISGTGKVVYQPWPWDEYPKTKNRDTVKYVVVEEGITELSAGALFHLPNAVSVELPQFLTSISGDVFWQCYSLKDVTIPAQVSYLHPQAFRECTSLTSIKVDEANPFLCSYEGAVFSKDMRELICFPDGRDGSFCVPEGVTLIGNRVFSWCMALKELRLPQSVSYIGSDVFPGQDKVSTDAPGKTALTLVVPKGSYAERYAIENSMDYRAVDVPTQAEPDRVQVTINLGTIKTNNLDRFKAVKTYQDGMFRDVNSDAWYAANVAAVYGFG